MSSLTIASLAVLIFAILAVIAVKITEKKKHA